MGSGKRWYVIHTYSGYENKVKTTLEQKIQSMELEDKIGQILLPTEDVIEYDSKGREKIVKKKIYPSYLFIEMEVNDRTWYVVRNTPGVTGFVGTATKPVSLSEREVQDVMRLMEKGQTPKRNQVELGKRYRITEDTYRYGMTGTAVHVNDVEGTVTLSMDDVSVKTEAEIDWQYVEPIE